MKFEWDEEKRKSNLFKHGIDFKDAEQIFEGITYTFEDERFSYGEYRYITLGMFGGTVVVVAHTERNDVIRLISIRKATKNEQEFYYKGFGN
jgi:uncharacterized DUF497 family protein